MHLSETLGRTNTLKKPSIHLQNSIKYHAFKRNSPNMKEARLLLACMACMALSVPACLAVTCDSFTVSEQCNGVMTDAGECTWNETDNVCELGGGGLPDGMVGITSVPEVEGMCQVHVDRPE